MLVAVLTLAALIYAYPLSYWLLPNEARRVPLLSLVTGFGLSVGLLTWSMALVSVAARPMFGLPVAVSMMAVVFIASSALVARESDRPVASRLSLLRSLDRPKDWLSSLGHTFLTDAGWVLLIVTGVAFGIAFLLVWRILDSPFWGWDTLAIYARQARSFYMERGFDLLQTESRYHPIPVYWSYPKLIPLAYAYAYLAAGAVNEMAAGIFIVGFAIAALGATFALGQSLYGRRIGLIATFIVAATPLFYRWAITGYTDTPVVLYTTLFILFSYRWLMSRDIQDALLAGIMLGFGTWTRNSALVFVLALFLITFAISAVSSWRRKRPALDFSWQELLVVFGSAFVCGGWWYLRNLFAHGYFVYSELSSLESQMNRAVWNLFPFGNSEPFGQLLAPLYMVGLFYALGQVSISPFSSPSSGNKSMSAERELLLLAYIVPFTIAWWAGASFTTRYLLPLVPPVAVLAGRALDRTLWPHLVSNRRAQIGVVVMVLMIGVPVMKWVGALPAVRWIRQGPAASLEQRREWYIGARYKVYEYVREKVTSDPSLRVLTSDPLMEYFDYPTTFEQGVPSSSDDLGPYAYFVWAPQAPAYFNLTEKQEFAVRSLLKDSPRLVKEFEVNGWVAYRIIHDE